MARVMGPGKILATFMGPERDKKKIEMVQKLQEGLSEIKIIKSEMGKALELWSGEETKGDFFNAWNLYDKLNTSENTLKTELEKIENKLQNDVQMINVRQLELSSFKILSELKKNPNVIHTEFTKKLIDVVSKWNRKNNQNESAFWKQQNYNIDWLNTDMDIEDIRAIPSEIWNSVRARQFEIKLKLIKYNITKAEIDKLFTLQTIAKIKNKLNTLLSAKQLPKDTSQQNWTDADVGKYVSTDDGVKLIKRGKTSTEKVPTKKFIRSISLDQAKGGDFIKTDSGFKMVEKVWKSATKKEANDAKYCRPEEAKKLKIAINFGGSPSNTIKKYIANGYAIIQGKQKKIIFKNNNYLEQQAELPAGWKIGNILTDYSH